ncbi:MAG: beta-ketoacyl-[acyl-carrier-protein] synthase family protein [Egibacteraceae bacterium]
MRSGRADAVVAGGAEAAVNPLLIAGFAAAGALSWRNGEPKRASRPFDVDRDGFVTGEGAGVLVLERTAHAAARGAKVLAELAGYNATNDAHHATQPSPGGAGAARALRLARAAAGCDPGDIDHCNAHGTSISPNDAAEAQALRTVFGTHALGAAGGVEAVATVMAVLEGVVSPTLNLDHQDPACDLDVVHGGPRACAIGAAVSNSFGFGGHNAVLVFRRA